MTNSAASRAFSDTPVDDVVQRALGVPSRAGIYRRLRTEGQPHSAREVADMFGLHPNVARNHLDVLADAGLVVTGQRKNPSGGRPAKVYVAREEAAGTTTKEVPPGSQLAVHVIVQLIAGLTEHEPKLELLAEDQGRRLVAAVSGKATNRDFEAAAVVAVEGLRAAFPEARLAASSRDAAIVEGLDVGLKLVGAVDGGVGDALARGFLRGALAAAGSAATVTSRGGVVRAEPDRGAGALPSPADTVDCRGQTYQAGVVATMRAIVPHPPGTYIEVLTDTKGAPAAFARWTDRAGHELVDVARIRDLKGKPAVRLLVRKGTGR